MADRPPLDWLRAAAAAVTAGVLDALEERRVQIPQRPPAKAPRCADHDPTDLDYQRAQRSAKRLGLRPLPPMKAKPR